MSFSNVFSGVISDSLKVSGHFLVKECNFMKPVFKNYYVPNVILISGSETRDFVGKVGRHVDLKLSMKGCSIKPRQSSDE